MSDLQELERRITAALERIGSGLQGVSSGGGGADEGDLARALDDERTANAQLAARVEALSARQTGKVAELEEQVAAQKEQLSALAAELESLRQSNADMREVNAQLRSAAADGAGSPELINRALMAEVDALQAQRRADATEIDAVMSELKQIIGGE